jgi:radical SAM superfamily enzyme YgiQ (UPF0313 family)
MKKIVLINPTYDYPVLKNVKFYYLNKIWPPLDLANYAALLEKEGFDVKIIDANAERLTPNQVAKMVNGFNKIFITSSTLDRWQCPHPNIKPFLEFVKVIREKNPNINIFVLGAHGTIRTKEILELTKVNAIIRSEPELTVVEICKNKSLKQIKGVTFKKGKRIISTPDRGPLDLNTLPIPAYHLLPLRKYFYEFLGGKFMLFEGSRGCPFNCIYCLKKMYGIYRKKSPENLIREVECAIKEFGVKTAYFIDLEFTVNKKLVEDLCDYLIKNNFDFKWCCQARFDTIDKNLLLKMKRAGCKLIHYGVETGSERILKLINKKITLEKIEKGMKLTKDVGIETACFFIFGLPTESLEDMKKTMDFAEKINPNYASFHIAIPYPETIFYDMIKKDLRDDLFPTSYTGIYSENQLKKIINYAYRRFYFRLSYIFSRLLNGNYELLLRQFKLFISHIR